MRLLDWLFRTFMLALAGLVTLSILGSIAAISTDTGPGGWIGRETPPAAESPPPPPETGPDSAEPARPGSSGAAGTGSTVVVAGGRPPGRWLEAIAYALLALAGLLAIALLLLASAARDLRRLADAIADRPAGR